MPRLHPITFAQCERTNRPRLLARACSLLCAIVAVSSCGPTSERIAGGASRPPLPPSQKGAKQMNEFNIGDVVRITGSVMPGSVGTVVSLDDKRGKYLVRITEAVQNYYTAEELELFRS